MLRAALNTRHGVRLACARLPVGENGSVVALKHVGDDGRGRVLVNLALSGAAVVADVERELLWGLVRAKRLRYENFAPLWVYLDHFLVAALLLSL